MTITPLDALGWAATAAFAASYAFRDPRALRKVQASAAAIWICYGVAIGSAPVVVSNVTVAGLALWSMVRGRGGAVAADEYVDSGFSGAKASRPALDELMADSAKRRFD